MSTITVCQFSDRPYVWKTDTHVKINVEAALTSYAKISAPTNTITAYLFSGNKTVLM